jgi:hypothetical protein
VLKGAESTHECRPLLHLSKQSDVAPDLLLPSSVLHLHLSYVQSCQKLRIIGWFDYIVWYNVVVVITQQRIEIVVQRKITGRYDLQSSSGATLSPNHTHDTGDDNEAAIDESVIFSDDAVWTATVALDFLVSDVSIHPES